MVFADPGRWPAGNRKVKKMGASIVVISCLDTKGDETAYFKELVEKRGHRVIVIDAGILFEPQFQPDITREQVAEAAGTSIGRLVELDNEREAIEIMGRGVSRIVSELHSSGRLDGIFALGGTMGTSLGLSAMNELPLGLPKVILSTVALTPFIRPDLVRNDITLMPSVVDLSGLNVVTRRMLENSAGAVVGAVEMSKSSSERESTPGKTVIGITTLGTAVCRYLAWLKPILEKMGYEVLVFHTIGTGGRSFEYALRQGLIDGALDLGTNELMNEVCGGSYLAGSDRLETAGRMGIPQVVSVGGLEAFGWGGPFETLPERFKDRKIQRHSKLTFGVKASNDEMAAVGRLMAEKLNKAMGPTAVVIPMGGFSEREKPGGPFHSPEGREYFARALRDHLDPKVQVISLDMHINDRSFSEEVVKIFGAMMKERKSGVGSTIEGP
jgi:uncharacterized protein (UPF0261 family)